MWGAGQRASFSITSSSFLGDPKFGKIFLFLLNLAR
jgi:hypothetical protein